MGYRASSGNFITNEGTAVFCRKKSCLKSKNNGVKCRFTSWFSAEDNSYSYFSLWMSLEHLELFVCR